MTDTTVHRPATGAGFALPAPAKLNLLLHITGRRADGYHDLQTLFVLLDHGDTLHFQADPALTLTCDHPHLPVDDDNLVLRAARLLRDATGCQRGARMHLQKRLPAGGGVGGGSSDAATALLGLNHLWQLNLGLDQLATLGLRLGADVPVFVRGRNAWAEGVGERLQAVDLPPLWFLVVDPGVAVSTARIFGDGELTRHTPAITLPASLGAATFEALLNNGHNDCEAVARRLFPPVDQALEWLQREAGNARMTGTGACCFARLAGAQAARDLKRRLPENWTAFVARSTELSPLHEALATLRAKQHPGPAFNDNAT
ncbi:4-(cytidine 5'-diphospho)-2-C-methyl-D-erythritol kinase [Alloalcanivorax gelatiniphagus]|uniref:4-diphosphocytidyl-2-C-methyl-D-erythritol kinase n=1 Tax=Alloalcanivorax gelatiniphagus TaxID=1194167 RepID=A0ABY2XHI0_9GAMM|nr:4-(cytidine 5'-diphospho)-2-C-methyl-D-erythritol kinase [Alloalcanivorax gelatiniphagus]TMW10602.1 4-(cytidine 5'-diphospho)-2-C-methyl-D-erythritol kinase [Alloalcanivorax gelatiniphagus]